jgi:hypothetical protein
MLFWLSRLLTIVGGAGVALVVRRRRHGNTLCVCGVLPAQQAGPSTSPLGILCGVARFS